MTPDYFLEAAIALAAQGYDILPAAPGTKEAWLPAWQQHATRDPGQIKAWWAEWPQSNPGLRGGNGVGFVDVDPRNGGDSSVRRLDLLGKILPVTRKVLTPSGGYHLHYKTTRPWKTSAGKIAAGIDIRGVGGYVLGPGSQLPAGPYLLEGPGWGDLAQAPEWLEEAAALADEPPAPREAPVISESAQARAVDYLDRLPAALKGSRGISAYRAAGVLKDFGLPLEDARVIMRWHFKSEPPMPPEELIASVNHVYKYGRQAVGELAPEKCFVDETQPKDEGPGDLIDQINESYAYVVLGGQARVIRDAPDHNGARRIDFLHLDTLRTRLANIKCDGGAFKAWLASTKRRTYDGVAFAPGRELPPEFFNLWQGWTIQPLPKGETPTPRAQAALDAFLLHVRNNIKRGEWLLGFAAHMFQRPEVKPLTAVVMRGGKGSGKSTIVEILGALLGPHYGRASDPKHVTGNFNAHFEGKLMFTFEEAFWGGAKAADSIIKTLTTSRQIRIERKGQDSFEIDSYLRLFILGNEKWLVPATPGERRYAVFDVNLTTHQPLTKEARAFFREMREGMEAGGYTLLLRFLLDYDISNVDVDEAPETEALAEQKEIGATPFQQWWNECLIEGAIVCSEFSVEWPTDIDKAVMRDAYGRYCASRRITGWLPTEIQFGKDLAAMFPSVKRDQKRREGERSINIYRLAPLEVARAEWSRFIGHEVKW